MNTHASIKTTLTPEQVAFALQQFSPRELQKLENIVARKNSKASYNILKSSYVRKIRSRMKELAPHRFTTPKTFLAQLYGK